MAVAKIKLNTVADVKDFVNAAEKCQHDVDVSYNRVVIDAKSLMGVMTMDLNNILTVNYHEEDAFLADTLARFAV